MFCKYSLEENKATVHTPDGDLVLTFATADKFHMHDNIWRKMDSRKFGVDDGAITDQIWVCDNEFMLLSWYDVGNRQMVSRYGGVEA